MDFTGDSTHRSRNGHRPPTRVELLNGVRRHGRRTDEDIHVCPDCDSELVQPVEWAPVDTRRWRVELRCPDCRWEHAGVFPQHVLDRFDTLLDEAAASIAEDLARLERSNMEDQAERFVFALAADQILPEDF